MNPEAIRHLSHTSFLSHQFKRVAYGLYRWGALVFIVALLTRPALGQSQVPTLCYTAFEKAVSRAVRFPSDAQQLGMSVRVYVRFKLNRDGKYGNVAVANLGLIDESFKKEVSRVWSVLPNQDHRCSGDYVIPITFMLGKDGSKQFEPIANSEDKVAEQGTYILLDEVSVSGYKLCELHDLIPYKKP